MERFIIIVLTDFIVLFLSWAITAFAVYLITLLIGLKFSLLAATGVWIALCLLKLAVF